MSYALRRSVLFRCLMIWIVAVLTGCGGGDGSSTVSPPSLISLFAGNIGGPGHLDGVGAAASFKSPSGVATDIAGNLYVADQYNHTIRKITPAGDVITLAGMAGVSGSEDGIGSAARFSQPAGLATDSAGNIYVADSTNVTIRKITPAGLVTTLAGKPGVSGAADGAGEAARFREPLGVATDRAGNIYVTDSSNFTVRKITSAGVVTTLAGSAGEYGSVDGTGTGARFTHLFGIAIDKLGNLYVVSSDHTLRKITPAGVVSTLAGGEIGSTDGVGLAARFHDPIGVAIDEDGNIYVSDNYTAIIRKVTSAGVVTTVAGAPGARDLVDGIGSTARFLSPSGVATDRSGNVYVLDDDTIRKMTVGGAVMTLAGSSARVRGASDGMGALARFGVIGPLTTDSAGNVYVSDTMNVNIRKITPEGMVSTFAGAVGERGLVDGAGSAARFLNPTGIATDSADNIYVFDAFICQKCDLPQGSLIRKISPTGVVTTIAGRLWEWGWADGVGSAARFDWVGGDLAVDSAGNIYVAEYANKTIRKISPGLVVTTLAGRAGEYGDNDGPGATARFRGPAGIVTDHVGNVYVADHGRIRKITQSGEVSTLAGSYLAEGSIDGLGEAASFQFAGGLAIDSSGNIYVADNNLIRKVTASGMVTTIIGTRGLDGFIPGIIPSVIKPAHAIALSGRTMYFTSFTGIARVTNVP